MHNGDGAFIFIDIDVIDTRLWFLLHSFLPGHIQQD